MVHALGGTRVRLMVNKLVLGVDLHRIYNAKFETQRCKLSRKSAIRV